MGKIFVFVRMDGTAVVKIVARVDFEGLFRESRDSLSPKE